MFSFQGRLNRIDFAYRFLLAGAASVPAAAMLNVFEGPTLTGPYQLSPAIGLSVAVVSVIAYLALMLPAAARRLHDIGWSARWLGLLALPALNLIPGVALPPIANQALLLLLLFAPGQQHANAYGAYGGQTAPNANGAPA